MKDEDILSITEAIDKKLDKETSATIADDLGILISKNSETQQLLQQQQARISELESKNEKLVSANNSLFQQISIGKKEELPTLEKDEEIETKVNYTFDDLFDDNGNFKH